MPKYLEGDGMPALIFFLLGSLLIPFAHADSLSTKAELTGFKETGRYEEVIRLCRAFQKGFPKKVRCITFGTTPEGRPMKALIVSGSGHLDAKQAHAAGDTVLYFQGGIHAGEIDGKDALFEWIRDALNSKNPSLKNLTLVAVPVFNIDGHERFSKNNRPNQIGPEEMGWRTTAWNINLNRDYTKAEAPEMQASLRLLNEWDPIVLVDLHVTDGAQFQSALSLGFVPNHLAKSVSSPTDANLELVGLAVDLENQMRDRLKKTVDSPLLIYPDFRQPNDPTSGIQDRISTPKFSHGYWGLRNRIGFLVETHSWKDYATRVRATYDTINSLVSLAAKNGKRWVLAAKHADEAATHLGGSKYTIRFEPSEKSRLIDFPGYAYKIDDSEVSGQKRITYDPSIKLNWKIPVFDELQAAKTVTLPKGGYLVDAAQADLVAQKLKIHGIRYEALSQPLTQVGVEAFRAESMNFAPTPFENRQKLTVTGDWHTENRSFLKGAIFVPIAQPKAPLIANLFEPVSDDSLLSWGYFNIWFHQVEYMEDYVAEQVALEMLKDPTIKKEFDEKLKDKAFASDSKKRLEFFHRHHPSWDERFGLYPVYRVQQKP